MCYGANLMEQNFEQKNTTFPKFMMNVVDVTVSNKCHAVVDERDTKKYLQLSSITLEVSTLSLQFLLYWIK